MRAINLKTEHMKNPMGIDVINPVLSWVCEGGVRQSAYEVCVRAKKAGEEEGVLWESGKVRSNQMQIKLPVRLESRMACVWRVRLWDEADVCGGWSREAVFETAFLEKSCWEAKWINPEHPTMIGKDGEYQPASYLRREFELSENDTKDEESVYRLYITAHGLYTAYINGKRVGDAQLTPGTSQYDRRLLYQTYDVKELLIPGKNVMEVMLGNGWYRGSNGITGSRNVFGTDLGLLCQLEKNGKAILISDRMWQASQEGPNRSNDMQQGEIYDAGMEQISVWHSAVESDSEEGTFLGDILVCSNSVPIREQEEFEGTWIFVPNREDVLDFGQNMAGYTEFSLSAPAGSTVILTHGETLDENGNFTVANFQPGGRTPRNLDQKITYICKEGENHFKPSFSIFGFRYVKVEIEVPEGSDAAEVKKSLRVKAHALYSDMERSGWFTCSDEFVNRLVRNALWSQRSNFADVPTDCPTRERAGYTGDAQVYIPTALYLADCYPIFRKWLSELRMAQFEDGTIPGVAPIQEPVGGFSAMMAGSAGWGDACVIVPYMLWMRYRDLSIVEENYHMMTKWVERCRRLAEKNHQKNEGKDDPYLKYVIDTGCHWGEWLEPDIPSEVALRNNLMNGAPEVATAYFFYSTMLLSKMADALGKTEDAENYRKLAANIRKGYQRVVLGGKKVTSERQCEYVRPIAMGLLDEEMEKEAVEDLNALVIKNGYHLNTGFLSTPWLCGVLSDHGYEDTAYRLLLQDTCPSWLYAVKKGATTIWETWDGIREDGTVHDSFNHYSYGAVVGWLFGNVCGIRLEGEKLVIAPEPGKQLAYARAVYDSPAGRIESGWERKDGKEIFTITVPSNMRAEVHLPGKEIREVGAGTWKFE